MSTAVWDRSRSKGGARLVLLAMADELFAVVASGQVRLSINQRYPLEDAATAHRELEARRTTGSTILIP